MKLQVFNGGINNGIATHLVQQHEAIKFENIDVASAILAPLKGNETIADLPLKERYGYYFKGSFQLTYVESLTFARFKSTLLSSLDGELQLLDEIGFEAAPHQTNHWKPVIIGNPEKLEVCSKCVGNPTESTPNATYFAPDNVEFDDCLVASIQAVGTPTTDGTMNHTEGGVALYKMYLGEDIGEVIPSTDGTTIPINYDDNYSLDTELSPLGTDGCVLDIDVYIQSSDVLSIRTSDDILVWESSANLNLFNGEHLVAKVTIDSVTAKVTFVADGTGTSLGGTITATRMNPTMGDYFTRTYWDSIQVPITSTSATGGIVIDLNVLDVRFTEAHPNARMIFTAYKENIETIIADIPLEEVGHTQFVDSSDLISVRPPFIAIPLSIREQGNFTYAVTYVDSRGYESCPTYAPEVVMGKGGVCILTASINWDLEMNIYRVGGAISVFTMVASGWRGGTYIDYIHSDDLDINVLETQDNISEMEVDIVAVHSNVVWASSGHTLRFSDINREWSWNAFSWVKFKEDITGVISTKNGLFVATVSSIGIILGDTRDSLVVMEISNKIGCTHHNTLKDYKGALFFLSREGIYQLSGTNLSCITSQKIPNFIAPAENYIPSGDTYYENIANPTGYAMVHNDKYWLQNKYDFLVYDIKRRVFFTYKPADRGLDSPMLSVMGQSEYIYGVKGVMFIWAEDIPNDTFVDETCTPTNPHNAVEMVMQYRSPILTEGEYTNHKIYDNFFVAYSGSIAVTIFIDGINRGDFVLNSNKRMIQEIRIPVTYKRGYSIQFEISGTGTVYELVYNILPKQGGN